MTIDSLSSFASTIALGWAVVATIAVMAALDTLRSGSGRAASFVLALPATLFLYELLGSAVALASLSSVLTTPISEALLFLAMLVGIYVLTRRMTDSWGERGGPLQALVAGVSFAAVLCVVWVSLPVLLALWDPGEQVRAVFSEGYRFWWVLGAYVTLGFVRG